MALEGNFIRLDIHREWFKDPEALAKRLALILVGQQNGYQPYFTGFHWQLDSGNDWFLHEKEGIWYLNTRYWTLENRALLDKVLTLLLKY